MDSSRALCVLLGNNGAHPPDWLGINTRRQQEHGLIAALILRIPYANIRNRQIAPEQSAFAVSGSIFIKLRILSRQQIGRIEVSAELVWLPRSISVWLAGYLPRLAIRFKIQ